METQRLKYFLRLSETLHFSQTAAEFHIAQSVLSNHIKILERQFNCRLFERSNRWKISLTPAGKELAAQAKIVLHTEKSAAEKVQAASRGEAGILNIGFNPSALNLTPLLTTFHEISCHYPSIQLNLQECPSDTVYRLVQDEQLDLGFLRIYPGGDPELMIRQVAAEHLAVVVPPTHRFAKRRSLRLADLKDEYLLLVGRKESQTLRDAIDSACQKAGLIPKIRTELASLVMIMRLLDALNAISIVPIAFQRHYPDLIFLPIDDCDTTLPEAVIWKKENSSAVLKTFLAIFYRHTPPRSAKR